MSRNIEHRFFFSHAPEAVWHCLTDSALIAEWLMENDFKPVAGHEFQFRTKPLPNFNFNGIIYCKVLEIVTAKKLVYSWKGGPGDGSTSLDSVVVWELQPKDKGTELLLQHSGFPETAGFSMYAVMQQGWLERIHKIEELLNNKATQN